MKKFAIVALLFAFSTGFSFAADQEKLPLCKAKEARQVCKIAKNTKELEKKDALYQEAITKFNCSCLKTKSTKVKKAPAAPAAEAAAPAAAAPAEAAAPAAAPAEAAAPAAETK